MSNCDAFEPLSPREVKNEVRTLEDLAKRFVTGDKPHDVAKAWQDELQRLYLAGQDSAEKVFQQMVADSKNSKDPNFPKITETYATAPLNGGTTISLDVSPPDASSAVYPSLDAAIDNNNVWSYAQLSETDKHDRNTPTGRINLARKLCWNEADHKGP